MKRKLCLEELKDKKTGKMLRLSETMVEMSDIANITSVTEVRKLNFKLTDKKAKSSLLKSANRCHFEVETKQKSKNLRFSAGAFIHVAKQMIKECESKFRNKSLLIHNKMEIKVD